MASLQSIAEVAYLQMFPVPSDETPISKEEFIETAKGEFAYQQLLMAWKDKRDEGFFEVPSYLSVEVEKDVVNNEIDISDLEVFKSLPQDVWLQNIGGLTCRCKYVKSDINLTQLMCGDDSLDDDVRTYIVVGNKIKFPLGAHTTPLPIIYANKGEGVDGYIEVDEAIGAIIRTRLNEIYGGKVGVEDKTNNENSQN